jgi:hypothetical protein
MFKRTSLLIVFAFLCGFAGTPARPSLKEILTASNNVLVVFIAGDSRDANAVSIEDISKWKINGEPAYGIYKYSTSSDVSHCYSNNQCPDCYENREKGI